MIALKVDFDIALLTIGFIGLFLAAGLSIWYYAFDEKLTMRLFAVILYSIFLFLNSMYAYNSITSEQKSVRFVLASWLGSNLFVLIFVALILYFY